LHPPAAPTDETSASPSAETPLSPKRGRDAGRLSNGPLMAVGCQLRPFVPASCFLIPSFGSGGNILPSRRAWLFVVARAAVKDGASALPQPPPCRLRARRHADLCRGQGPFRGRSPHVGVRGGRLTAPSDV